MESGDMLPPPPPVPANVVPIRIAQVPQPQRKPMARSGLGRSGQKVQILANHFAVKIPSNMDGFFFHYSVAICSSEDEKVIDNKGIGRKVIDRVQQTYASELGGKDFAYDGEKSLFTFGELPSNMNEFIIVLEEAKAQRNGNGNGNGNDNGNGSPSDPDKKRSKRSFRSRSFKVTLNYAAKIPLKSLAAAIRGEESGEESLRVLDIILRQQAAKKGCLLVRQSFFHDDPQGTIKIGGGVNGCRGFHASFRPTQGGLSLNMDVSTTMIYQPGPVINFLVDNQGVRDPSQIDWQKARKMLKNLRIQTTHSKTEWKIIGLSEKICSEQCFSLRSRSGDESSAVEITVYNYFVRERGYNLNYSGDLPCIDVGRPKRPNYLPIEVCNLVPLQRYTKSLSGQQRSSLVEQSRQKPDERMKSLTHAMSLSKYDEDPMLASCGIKINKQFASVDGRVLEPPKLIFGGNSSLVPRNGRWNLNNKQMFQPAKIERWAIVNFSARCNVHQLAQDLVRCGGTKGLLIEPPHTCVEESPQFRNSNPTVRVERMIEELKNNLPGPPQFLLCILSERKNSHVYGPWKRKALSELGVVTQCLAPGRINDQYLTNVLMKINSKLGGINSLLAGEQQPRLPIVSSSPTMIMGIDVSHGSPGQSDRPSIAAVVSSREWPFVSRYRASVRTQSPKLEIVDSLFQLSEDGKTDGGVMREALIDFYKSSKSKKPERLLIFRDGVSESQFAQVLNLEIEAIIKACDFLEAGYKPKITLIIAQKNHHTKLFVPNSRDNVQPGTVVDSGICHPKNFDFYMCAHAGMIGTTRPAHYHVLMDENAFPADDLQVLIHNLSYTYQRSTTAVSIVAPISYAHLAAAQMQQFVKMEDMSDGSSSHGGVTSDGTVPVLELPKLHENVKSSMFFC